VTNAPDPEPDRPDSPADPSDLGPDDQVAVDRAFAEIVARFHSGVGPETDPEPLPPEQPRADEEPEDRFEPPVAWAEDHPLFVYDTTPDPEPEYVDDEHYQPEPPPPLPRPSWPTLLATIALAYATLAMVALILGVPLPGWAGVLAICGFVVGCAILAFRLPRHRPPDSDDGAVL